MTKCADEQGNRCAFLSPIRHLALAEARPASCVSYTGRRRCSGTSPSSRTTSPTAPSESGLLSLLRRCHLTRREQRVMAAVLGANTPMTARAVAMSSTAAIIALDG